MTLVFDSGAISALAAGDPRVRHILTKARAAGVVARTASVVVAEVTTGRGPTDAATNRVLAGMDVVGVGEQLARAAGALRYRSGIPGTVDAVVVATAQASGGGVVLTADADDLGRLASVAVNVEVRRW